MMSDGHDGWLTVSELARLGVCHGRDVRVSRYARIVGKPVNLHLGDRVRIDDFVQIVLVPGRVVRLENDVHIGNHSSLHGGAGITIEERTHLSAGVRVFSTSDSFIQLGAPPISGFIRIAADCIVGANSVLLPGASMEWGAVLGANSGAKNVLGAWKVYAGSPVRFIKHRSRSNV